MVTEAGSEGPIDVVRSLDDAFEARDEDRLRAVLDPEVSWEQNARFPGGGRHVGVDAVLRSVFDVRGGRIVRYRQ